MPDLAQSVVLYHTRTGTLPDPGAHNIIWKASVNGTGTQALIETQLDLEHIMDAIGPWVVYGVALRSWAPHSVSLDGSVIHSFALFGGSFYARSVGGRAVLMQCDFAPTCTDLYSVLPDATDLRHLTAIPPVPSDEFVVFGTMGAAGNQLIYSVQSIRPLNPFRTSLLCLSRAAQ